MEATAFAHVRTARMFPCRYSLRHRPSQHRPSQPPPAEPAAASSRLFDLQPELLEHLASKLNLNDLSMLAATCHAATPLQSAVVSMRISALRALTSGSHARLVALIDKLPVCAARVEITTVIESSMSTFRSVCTCNEDFLRLSRAVALRGLAAPFQSPVDAARLARSCCQTCDDVERALQAVTSWLTELTLIVERAGRRGERALLAASEQSPGSDGTDLVGEGGGDAAGNVVAQDAAAEPDAAVVVQ